jgi:C1A family cysteine protease
MIILAAFTATTLALVSPSPAFAKCKGDLICKAKEKAAKKAKALKEASKKAAKAAADTKAAKAAAEKAKALKEASEKAAKAAAATKAAQAAKAAASKTVKKLGINLDLKETVNLSDITRGITRDKNGIWYEHSPRKKTRLQPTFGSSSSQESNVVNLGYVEVTDTSVRPGSVRKFEAYWTETNLAAAPSKKVSHRGKQSSVDDQGNRGTCVAFATAAAMEALLGDKLSKEYLYSRYKKGDVVKTCNGHGLDFFQAKKVLETDPIPKEKLWGYLNTTSTPGNGVGVCPGNPPKNAKKNAKFKASGVYQLSSNHEYFGKAVVNNPKFIEAWIAGGYDVVIGVGVAWKHKKNAMGLFDMKGVIDVKKVNGKPAKSQGGHAMLFVGYERTGKENIGGGYFLVKNSWGKNHGDNGYLKISYDYIREYAHSGLVITGLTR